MKFSEFLLEGKLLTGINWREHTGDWVAAKAAGADIFKKFEGEKNIDTVLKLHDEAEVERKRGSYLAAVLADKFKDRAEALGKTNHD